MFNETRLVVTNTELEQQHYKEQYACANPNFNLKMQQTMYTTDITTTRTNNTRGETMAKYVHPQEVATTCTNARVAKTRATTQSTDKITL